MSTSAMAILDNLSPAVRNKQEVRKLAKAVARERNAKKRAEEAAEPSLFSALTVSGATGFALGYADARVGEDFLGGKASPSAIAGGALVAYGAFAKSKLAIDAARVAVGVHMYGAGVRAGGGQLAILDAETDEDTATASQE